MNEDNGLIVPTDYPTKRDHVFMLSTPGHVLTKLHWEIYSLRKSLHEKPEHIGHTHAPAYHAFNCSVTAWHLLDWAWGAASEEQRAYMLSQFGHTRANNDSSDFKTFVNAVREASRAIHICRQIATGSKHMVVATWPDPTVQADQRWDIEPARVGTFAAGDPLREFHYRLVIVDNGIEREAVDVFEDAFKAWERFLGEWGFIEGRLIEAPSRPLKQDF